MAPIIHVTRCEEGAFIRDFVLNEPWWVNNVEWFRPRGAPAGMQDLIERERQSREPDPDQFGEEFASTITDLKWCVTESDELERAFSETRYQRLRVKRKEVGMRLNQLGGTILMEFALYAYVHNRDNLRDMFDLDFQGIGQWVA